MNTYVKKLERFIILFSYFEIYYTYKNTVDTKSKKLKYTYSKYKY